MQSQPTLFSEMSRNVHSGHLHPSNSETFGRKDEGGHAGEASVQQKKSQLFLKRCSMHISCTLQIVRSEKAERGDLKKLQDEMQTSVSQINMVLTMMLFHHFPGNRFWYLQDAFWQDFWNLDSEGCDLIFWSFELRAELQSWIWIRCHLRFQVGASFEWWTAVRAPN